ncbi:MAG: hypothetical protein CMA53_01350 [Euryarchaeota archaeon]|nr:hypothetical protein [Euryarchaeota archaeon]
MKSVIVAVCLLLVPSPFDISNLMSLKFATLVFGSITNESLITTCFRCSVVSPVKNVTLLSFVLFATPMIEPSDIGILTSCVTFSASISLGFCPLSNCVFDIPT